MKNLKNNGIVKAAKWPSIVIAALALLFGTNLLGNFISLPFTQKRIEEKLIELKVDVDINSAVLDSHAENIAENEKGIAVIQKTVEGIDERTKQTQEDVREIRRLIIQGR